MPLKKAVKKLTGLPKPREGQTDGQQAGYVAPRATQRIGLGATGYRKPTPSYTQPAQLPAPAPQPPISQTNVAGRFPGMPSLPLAAVFTTHNAAPLREIEQPQGLPTPAPPAQQSGPLAGPALPNYLPGKANSQWATPVGEQLHNGIESFRGLADQNPREAEAARQSQAIAMNNEYLTNRVQDRVAFNQSFLPTPGQSMRAQPVALPGGDVAPPLQQSVLASLASRQIDPRIDQMDDAYGTVRNDMEGLMQMQVDNAVRRAQLEAIQGTQFGAAPAPQNAALIAGATEANAGNVRTGPRVGTEGLGLPAPAPDLQAAHQAALDAERAKYAGFMDDAHGGPKSYATNWNPATGQKIFGDPLPATLPSGEIDPSSAAGAIKRARTDRGIHASGQERDAQQRVAQRAAHQSRRHGLPPAVAQAGIQGLDALAADPNAELTDLQRLGATGLPPMPQEPSQDYIAWANGRNSYLGSGNVDPAILAQIDAQKPPLYDSGGGLPTTTHAPITQDEIAALKEQYPDKEQFKEALRHKGYSEEEINEVAETEFAPTYLSQAMEGPAGTVFKAALSPAYALWDAWNQPLDNKRSMKQTAKRS
jgi:hypothetical protein